MLTESEFVGRYVPALMAIHAAHHAVLTDSILEDVAGHALRQATVAWKAYRKEWLARDLAANEEIAREARESDGVEGMSRPYSGVPEMIRDTCDPEFADDIDRVVGEKLRLQEAAPDLLEALRDLVSEMGDGDMMVISREDLDRARAAIEKATGGNRA